MMNNLENLIEEKESQLKWIDGLMFETKESYEKKSKLLKEVAILKLETLKNKDGKTL